MRRSPFTNHLTKETLPVAAVTATTDGSSVDRKDGQHELFRSALIVIHAGSWTDGTHTFELQESDDNSTFTAVSSDDMEGTAPVIDAGADGDQVYEMGYVGASRYLRVSVTVSGATSGATYGSSVVLYDPALAPADHS